jgi:hypothetical protein
LFLKAPGSATWAFQQLSDVKSTNLSSSKIAELKECSANYYIDIASVGVTLDGKTFSGEYIDIICGID